MSFQQSTANGNRTRQALDAKTKPLSFEDYLRDGEIETIARRAIEKALGGDITFIRYVLDSIDPV